MNVHWRASRDGLAVFRGDDMVAMIPFGSFGALVYDLLKAMKG